MHDDPTPVLREDRLYITEDRLVCGRPRCAGMTALYTGRTIGGYLIRPLGEADGRLYEARNVNPVCVCGQVRWPYEDGRDA
jgi:hypothetical protein